uniref:Uncharacterized protein n=1 Tax=Rhizophora mucronata TaxID=61149 RepID=A0A2P2P5C0_RHIMU
MLLLCWGSGLIMSGCLPHIC